MLAIWMLTYCLYANVNSKSYTIKLINDSTIGYPSKFLSFDTYTNKTTIIPTVPALKNYHNYAGPGTICSDTYYSTYLGDSDHSESGIVSINLVTNNLIHYQTATYTNLSTRVVYDALECGDEPNELYGAVPVVIGVVDNANRYNIHVNKLTFNDETGNMTVDILTEIKNVSWTQAPMLFTLDVINKVFYYSSFNEHELNPKGSLYIANLTSGDIHGPYTYPNISYNEYSLPYLVFPPSNNGYNINNFNPNYFSGVITKIGGGFWWCNFTVNYHTNNTNIGLLNECERLQGPNSGLWFGSFYLDTDTFCGDGIAFVPNYYLEQYSTLNPLNRIAEYKLNGVHFASGIVCSVNND